MKKEKLLEKLKNTYCRLKCSDIEGVGVFAIQDIPEGVNPFNKDDSEWLKFHIYELKNLNPEIIKMIDDFFVIEEDGSVLIPEGGLNGIDISFFVNNSDNSNLYTSDEGLSFKTLRHIKKGEELTVAYSSYDYKYKKKGDN